MSQLYYFFYLGLDADAADRNRTSNIFEKGSKEKEMGLKQVASHGHGRLF
jgi:hypothetical protein